MAARKKGILRSRYALLIVGLLILVLCADTLRTSAAVFTFGNTAVGSVVNSFSSNTGSSSSSPYFSKEAGLFWMPNTGSVQSITAYFGNSNFQARAAIYSDRNGMPNLLVCGSKTEYIATAGWHTFSVPQTMVSSGYYWICVITDNPSAEGRMTPSVTENTHSWKLVSSFDGEFTFIFGTPTAFDSYSPSFYATYIYGTATPTPSQSPTATPTITPSPTSSANPGGSSVFRPEEPTPSPTPIRTPSPTTSPTPVPTLSPTPSLTPSPTPTRSPSPQPTADIGVYTDITCTTPLSAVNWPALQAGASSNKIIYIRNNVDRDVTLELSTKNWSPPAASVYLTLRWNYANQVLKPKQVITLTITLDVAPNILVDLADFTYEMVVTAKS